jgi:hypothetical protein
MKAALPLLMFAFLASCQTKDDAPEPPAPEKPVVIMKPSPEPEKPAAIDVSEPDSLVGLPVEDVQAACKAAGVRCRVVEVDGEPMIVTMDFLPDRLNFKVAAGKITAVTKG